MDKNKFQVGVWVCEGVYDRIGFITKISPENERCFVQMVRNPDGTENDTNGWFKYSALYVLPPSIHEDDIHSLQHVAVLWKDEEWFKELAGRKGE